LWQIAQTPRVKHLCPTIVSGFACDVIRGPEGYHACRRGELLTIVHRYLVRAIVSMAAKAHDMSLLRMEPTEIPSREFFFERHLDDEAAVQLLWPPMAVVSGYLTDCSALTEIEIASWRRRLVAVCLLFVVGWGCKRFGNLIARHRLGLSNPERKELFFSACVPNVMCDVKAWLLRCPLELHWWIVIAEPQRRVTGKAHLYSLP